MWVETSAVVQSIDEYDANEHENEKDNVSLMPFPVCCPFMNKKNKVVVVGIALDLDLVKLRGFDLHLVQHSYLCNVLFQLACSFHYCYYCCFFIYWD